jgi:hypothetical protein
MEGCGVLLSALLATATPPPPSAGTSGQEQSPESQSPDAEEGSPDQEGGVNPARLIPRLELRQRFTRLEGGGRLHTSTWRLDLVLFRRALLRYELPLISHRTVGGTSSGIGDMRISAIGLVSSGPRHAAVLIAGLVLDSASVPSLGTGKSQVTLGGAAAYRPLRFWLTYGIVGEQLSFAGDPARRPINQLLLEWGNIVFDGRGGWYLLDLDVTHDFEAGPTRFIPQLELGHLLIGRVALYLRAGTQLLGPRQLDYFVDAGLRYLFRL